MPRGCWICIGVGDMYRGFETGTDSPKMAQNSSVDNPKIIQNIEISRVNTTQDPQRLNMEMQWVLFTVY